MRIQNNVMAMNTHRMYTINNSNIQKSAEKLSSGYRINRAGDDAAGLAISEKMRSQIRGLNMASKNSQDAISLVQTAEGALQEVHSMLQRMNELSVQSATGTNQEIDRNQLAKEFNQLKREINDIAEQTTFNNMKILDGSLSNEGPQRSAQTAGIYASKVEGETQIPATALSFTVDLTGANLGTGGTITKLSIGSIEFDSLGLTTSSLSQNADATDIANAIANNLSANTEWTVTASNGVLTFTSKTPGTGVTAPTNGAAFTLATGGNGATATSATVSATPGAAATSVQGTSTVIEFDATKMKDGDKIDIAVGGKQYQATWHDGDTLADFLTALTGSASATTAEVTVKGNTLTFIGQDVSQAAIGLAFSERTPVDPNSFGTMRIQVGALENEQLNVEIKSMNSKGLGLDGSDLSGQDTAGKAITSTRDAINLVSDQRSLLGAMQNRLEHKISNLDNTAENLQSAESRIRDVDVAKEMTNYTKNNILAQASTAMLAQANAAPQSVLSLLQ